MSSPWFRMDQLLKCGYCSNKYTNPKLLPCNHTFCSEPCLERLVERSKQQVKCPECSCDHRVPLGGIQAFPNNVTLGRFLELRQQVNGREPDLPASMQRCNTCKERGQLEMCGHCNRKVCKDCKTAHINILRKEISLINDEVREGLKLLCKILNDTKQNSEKLQKNYLQVKDEIEEVVRRYRKDLLNTESKLKHEIELYMRTELGGMQRLEHDLQIEMNNANSNCDLADKHVNNEVDWTDAELTDYKDIFMKTLDFLRTFDSDPADCVKKIKFHPRADPDVVHKTLLDFAELKFNDDVNNNNSNQNNSTEYINGNIQNLGPSLMLTPPQFNSLARSQSDNRLANQRQRNDAAKNRADESDREPVPYARRRYTRESRDSCEREIVSTREEKDHLGVSSWRRDHDDNRTAQRNRFSSRELVEESDNYEKESSPGRTRTVRFEERSVVAPLQRLINHVAETEDATKGPLSGVIKILDSPHVMEKLHHNEVRQKKLKEEEERRAKQPPPPPPRVSRPMNRQLSEDEIEKQKKENKAAAAANATKVNSPTSESRPRTRITLDDDSRNVSSRLSSYTNRSTIAEEYNTTNHKASAVDEEKPTRLRNWRSPTSTDNKDYNQSPPSSPTRFNRDGQKPPVSPRIRETLTTTRPSSRPFLTKSSSLDNDDRIQEPAPTPPLTQRRMLGNTSRSTSLDQKDEQIKPNLRLGIPSRPDPPEVSSSSSSESESEEDSDTVTKRGDISPSVNTLLARSAQARRQSASTQARLLGKKDEETKRPSNRPWRENLKKEEDPVPSPRRRAVAIAETDERSSPYSRVLYGEKRRSSLMSNRYGHEGSPEERNHNGESYTPARRNRISRSKSSHELALDDSPDEDSLTSIRNRYRNRKAKEKSPEEPTNSWSQYLKNKYGHTRTSTGSPPNMIARSRTSAALALPPQNGSDNSSDDETTTRRREYRRHVENSSPRSFSMPRRTYMVKGIPSLKIGSRGTEQGRFTWPRGVCVGSDNTIVVADSSNHRIQVFHPTGRFIQEFGCYGSNEGEFDCLAAVAVNRIGQFIVSDRYNHRVQVFDPSGRFVRSFGSEGRGDGKFSYPWGVATDNLGFIYVCDKENHRVQVFQGDGTYVTKFGGIGQRPGELEHPHYVTVSSTNRVIVSDSNNHRIQIFDVNGRLLSTFGTEGSDEGQFKYPRGVAVDDQGYLIVGDSGNNRIQVFHPDGTFLKAFGTWGAAEGEFKGLEGISVSSSGQILVCDRENHRIQVF